jgi:recombination protein RecT
MADQTQTPPKQEAPKQAPPEKPKQQNVKMTKLKQTVLAVKNYLATPDNNTRLLNIFGGDKTQVGRFQDSLLMQMSKNPKIAECTVTSILECAFNIALCGLIPDGRNAHLIPFNNKRAKTVTCTLIIDYKGYVDQILNNHDYIDIKAIVVYENEVFELEFGEVKVHKQIIDPTKRGKVIGAYSMVKHLSGIPLFCFMTIKEIYDIRDNSQGYKSAVQYENDCIWMTNEMEMVKKTLIRRHQKTLKLTSQATHMMTIPEIELFRESHDTPDAFNMPVESEVNL